MGHHFAQVGIIRDGTLRDSFLKGRPSLRHLAGRSLHPQILADGGPAAFAVLVDTLQQHLVFLIVPQLSLFSSGFLLLDGRREE
jgi:hypothetical protein